MKKILYLLIACVTLMSCDRLYDTPLDDDRFNAGVDDPDPKFYLDQYDALSDEGQFWHPDAFEGMPANPTYVYQLYNMAASDIDDPDVEGGFATDAWGSGLQYNLLSQSFAGLNDRLIGKGDIVAGAWIDGKDAIDAYRELMVDQSLAATWIVWTGNPMTNRGFDAIDGNSAVMQGSSYVLTDVSNNPESGIVAIVASHVYSAYIVDVRDQAFYDEKGFTMVYDATEKTTEDSWNEFKDKCDNSALVVMPVHTGEMADFAIANGLFVMNLNKEYNTDAAGQNADLFKEVLAWLEPNSPVYGWEPGIGEDVFVEPVSKSGNMMVALTERNIPYFSKDYKTTRTQNLAKVIDPHDIDFTTNATNKFVSYYLSDGPHAGWMMNGFVENYLTDVNVETVNMSFGITASNASQICPLQFAKIMTSHTDASTLIESFGGGYWYSDDFGTSGDRSSLLASLAKKVASHMRQNRIKVLEQIAHDPTSADAIETYQAFVDANDQLEGIIAIEYAPSYAGGAGEIMWVTNKEGYDIPIITVRYSIWNFGDYNQERDGTPTYVANKLNAESAENKFSSVIVHAWSTFTDTGESTDELAENADGGSIRGASAAEMCDRRLDDSYQTVNIQELIWRVRMEYRPEQTEQFLNEYY